MLDRAELESALKCKGDCYECKMPMPDEEFSCVHLLAQTAIAQQQEIEHLADETIKLMRENAQNSMRAESLAAEKDELVKVLKQARDAINGYSTCPYCWGVNGHAKGCKFCEALQNIDALIGGEEDV